jgi:hypothetical protein
MGHTGPADRASREDWLPGDAIKAGAAGLHGAEQIARGAPVQAIGVRKQRPGINSHPLSMTFWSRDKR